MKLLPETDPSSVGSQLVPQLHEDLSALSLGHSGAQPGFYEERSDIGSPAQNLPEHLGLVLKPIRDRKRGGRALRALLSRTWSNRILYGFMSWK